MKIINYRVKALKTKVIKKASPSPLKTLFYITSMAKRKIGLYEAAPRHVNKGILLPESSFQQNHPSLYLIVAHFNLNVLLQIMVYL